MAVNQQLDDINIFDHMSPLPTFKDVDWDMTGQEAYDFMAQQEQSDANSLWGKVGDLLGLSDHASQADYYRTLANRSYESNAVAQARLWDEYMQSTQYQRSVQDMLRAGLNPWLATSNLNSSGASSATTGGRTGYSDSSSKSASSAGVLIVLGLVKLFTSLFAGKGASKAMNVMKLNNYR